MTTLIVDEPKRGKTTGLIRKVAEDEKHGIVGYIVCHSHEEAYRIAHLAEDMELNIRFPLTYDEFLQRSYSGTHIDRLYIDNLRFLLAHISLVPIDTVVW